MFITELIFSSFRTFLSFIYGNIAVFGFKHWNQLKESDGFLKKKFILYHTKNTYFSRVYSEVGSKKSITHVKKQYDSEGTFASKFV